LISASTDTGRERIGVFGGTFDPIHVAHLAVAIAAKHQLQLDRVLLMVANVPWQKAKLRNISAASDRLAMVRAACNGYPGIEPSDVEMNRGGDSYTADTLAELSTTNRDLFLIIGSDLVPDLPTWKRWKEIPPLCTLAIAYRPGEEEGSELTPGWRSVPIRLPSLEISSTELRQMVAERRPIDFLVPEPHSSYRSTKAVSFRRERIFVEPQRSCRASAKL
jgi:nicotinate-nucleotide adenylyltransferase